MHRSKTEGKKVPYPDQNMSLLKNEKGDEPFIGDRTQKFNAKFLAQLDLEKSSMISEVRRAEREIKHSIGFRIAPSFQRKINRQPKTNISNLARVPLKRIKSHSFDTTADRTFGSSLFYDYKKKFKNIVNLEKIDDPIESSRKGHQPMSMRIVGYSNEKKEPLLFTAPVENYKEQKISSHRGYEKKSTRLTETGRYDSNSSLAGKGEQFGNSTSSSWRELNKKLDKSLHGRKDKVAMFIGSLTKVCSKTRFNSGVGASQKRPDFKKHADSSKNKKLFEAEI